MILSTSCMLFMLYKKNLSRFITVATHVIDFLKTGIFWTLLYPLIFAQHSKCKVAKNNKEFSAN